MSVSISCPHCFLPVDSQARTCKHCGVDLALAAVVAEQAVYEPPQIPADVPLAPEILVPRMGEYLLERGVLTAHGLKQALAYQGKQAAAGRKILVGQALLELNLVDRETLDEAITTQILQLQKALSDSNHQLEQRIKDRTQDLQRALDRLAELNQLKSNFIANISHELRTPLTHLKGYLDLLSDSGLGPLNEQQNDALTVLKRAEARLEHLIEDLIQFSLASKGELSLTLESTKVSDLVQLAVVRTRPKARAAGLHLNAVLPPDCPPVQADSEKIGWVILQLLDNAVKFTQDGGRIEVRLTQEDALLHISVSDTGIGIPVERLTEVFEPFHQLDSSATRHYGGTGLGLAMVKRIVEAHGSQIKVQSIVGRGTRFEFVLPIVKNR